MNSFFLKEWCRTVSSLRQQLLRQRLSLVQDGRRQNGEVGAAADDAVASRRRRELQQLGDGQVSVVGLSQLVHLSLLLPRTVVILVLHRKY